MKGDKETALILGGGGFIGRELVKYLLKNSQDNILIVDKKVSDNFKRSIGDLSRIEIIEADLTEEKTYCKIKKPIQKVYFLAAIVGVNNTLGDPWKVLNTNTLLVQKFVDWALVNNSIEKILFSSTSEIYAGTIKLSENFIPTSEDVPVTLTDTRESRFAYAISKIFGENALYNAFKDTDKIVSIVRYHNVYGPAMGFKHVIPHVVERILHNENPLKVYGADQTRSFCYIADACESTYKVLENNEISGEIFHIGTSEEVSMMQLFKKILLLLDLSIELEEAPTYPGSVSRRCPDIKKLTSEIGFSPQFSLDEGLSLTVEWYKDYFTSFEKAETDGFVPPEGESR